MSPLIGAPNRGYADWQRIGNYDSGVEWSATYTNTGVTEVSPVIDMSRYAYLGGKVGCTLNTVLVTFLWYADAAATVLVGGRQFVLSAGIANPAQLRIPNLGPFVQVTLAPIGGANYTFNAEVIGTNRVHPCEMIPSQSTLLVVSGVTIPPGQTNFFPSDYFSGPARLTTTNSGGSVTCTLMYRNVDGTDQPIEQFGVNPAATILSASILVPEAAWYLAVFNGAAAQAFSCWITPSPTGSS